MNSNAFLNRELSWLDFNRRVLEEAQDPTVPLLERVKFLSIFTRTSTSFHDPGGHAQRRMHAGEPTSGPTTSPRPRRWRRWRADPPARGRAAPLLPAGDPAAAGAEGIVLMRPKDLSGEQERFLEEYFRRTVLPVLTPLAVDPGHPFPYVGNRSMCLVASIRRRRPRRCRRARWPSSTSRATCCRASCRCPIPTVATCSCCRRTSSG